MRNWGTRGRGYLVLALTLVLGGLFFAPSGSAAGTAVCTGTWSGGNVTGNLVAGPNCELDWSSVSGDVTVAANGSLAAYGASIGHDLKIEHTSATSLLCGVTVGHDAVIDNNSGSVWFINDCGGSSVGHDLNINHNTGGVTVYGTSVGHDLLCQADSPAVSLDSNPVVGHQITGPECTSATKTVKCPATGCTVTDSNGGVTLVATITGGHAGTVTVSVDPNAPDVDSCFAGEEDPPVVGVNPPAGDSVTLDITYPYPVYNLCKSMDGSPGSFAFNFIPSCSESEGPPCWQYVGESMNEVQVFLGPGDPFVTGG